MIDYEQRIVAAVLLAPSVNPTNPKLDEIQPTHDSLLQQGRPLTISNSDECRPSSKLHHLKYCFSSRCKTPTSNSHMVRGNDKKHLSDVRSSCATSTDVCDSSNRGIHFKVVERCRVALLSSSSTVNRCQCLSSCDVTFTAIMARGDGDTRERDNVIEAILKELSLCPVKLGHYLRDRMDVRVIQSLRVHY